MSEPSGTTIILQIGSKDLSDVAVCGKVNISTAPVYAPQSFTNVLGQQKKFYLGQSVHLKAAFEMLPKDVAEEIIRECSAETVEIQYLFPDEITAEFEQPQVNAVIAFGTEEEEYWDISLDTVCPLLPIDGL